MPSRPQGLAFISGHTAAVEAMRSVAAVALYCLSFSAAICMAYQPAMNAAKPMANSRSALVMLAYNMTAPARSCDFRP